MPDLNTQVQMMSQELKDFKGEVRGDIAEIKQLLKDQNASWVVLIDKKADGWVEDAIRYTVYTVAGVLIVAILGLILIKSSNISLSLL